MIILNNIRLSLDTDFDCLAPKAAAALRTDISNIINVKLYRKSVDARKKNDVHFCCSLIVEVKSDEENLINLCASANKYNPVKYEFKVAENIPQNRPIVVGFGPAGIFASLTLARAGLKPLVIERGADIERRTKDTELFFSTGKLNTCSNVQFGEGGAGTFSDGKLNTGIKDIRCRTVLETFNRFGAPEDILIDAKPHIGTDILKTVITNIRKEIINLGAEVRFDSKLESIEFADGAVRSVTVNGESIPCGRLILACGHSARDTFKMLKDSGVSLVKKPFSAGVRIEHLQSDIDKALYGDFAGHSALGPADYKLAVHPLGGRGVYTFCMCPGGEVINSSSEDEGISVNGMSNSRRDGKNANSAVLVSIEPDDLGDDVLSGLELQRKIEKKAYDIANGAVPVTTVGRFVFGDNTDIGRIKPTVKPRTAMADFDDIFPQFISENLKKGIRMFDRTIVGFAARDAVLTAPETRSSSPIRIVRDENGEAEGIRGFYPCGEGAGYAGGIMSASVDGIKSAERLIDSLK